MPRTTRSYGRPGTQVIPRGWAESHARVAEATMTAVIAFRVPGQSTRGTFNRETGKWEGGTAAGAYAAVPCRVQAQTNVPQVQDAADDRVVVSSYLVTIPRDTEGVAVGHLGAVSGSGDPLLDGRELRVDDIIRGSLRVERDLLCSLNG